MTNKYDNVLLTGDLNIDLLGKSKDTKVWYPLRV